MTYRQHNPHMHIWSPRNSGLRSVGYSKIASTALIQQSLKLFGILQLTRAFCALLQCVQNCVNKVSASLFSYTKQAHQRCLLPVTNHFDLHQVTLLNPWLSVKALYLECAPLMCRQQSKVLIATILTCHPPLQPPHGQSGVVCHSKMLEMKLIFGVKFWDL